MGSFPIILLFFFVLGSFAFEPQRMNHQLLEKIKLQEDFVHHFIFFDEQAFQKLYAQYEQQITEMQQQKGNSILYQDIHFYLNDCKSAPMKQCETKYEVPLMLLFNRIFIRFNGGQTVNQIDQIYDWIVSRITTSPILISNRQELLKSVEQRQEMFCYCHGTDQEMAYFFSLSKAMILTNYCILQNKTLYSELGLKSGNVTLFRNGSLDDRVEYEYPNRYDVWQMFLKLNVMSHVKKSDEIVKKRFSHEMKNIDTTIVICDFSFKCEQFWRQFQSWSRKFITQHPNVDIAMTFFDQKQVLLYNVYFATILNYTKFPALLNVKILSQNAKAGWFRRYLKYPQIIDSNQIINFVKDIEHGKVEEIQLSGQIPPKNGFTGKHAQKIIQKVVSKNLNQTIASSTKHYVLLLSTFGVGCNQCEEFYKQYRKAASFLSQEDITFGFMDVLKNKVQIDNVKRIPQILLYNKYFKDDPVLMEGRQSFDSLLRFLENNAIINYSGDL